MDLPVMEDKRVQSTIQLGKWGIGTRKTERCGSAFNCHRVNTGIARFKPPASSLYMWIKVGYLQSGVTTKLKNGWLVVVRLPVPGLIDLLLIDKTRGACSARPSRAEVPSQPIGSPRVQRSNIVKMQIKVIVPSHLRRNRGQPGCAVGLWGCLQRKG